MSKLTSLQFVKFDFLVVDAAVITRPLTVVVEFRENILKVGCILKLAGLLKVEVLYFLLGHSPCFEFVPVGKFLFIVYGDYAKVGFGIFQSKVFSLFLAFADSKEGFVGGGKPLVGNPKNEN